MRQISILAVAALAATAMSFPAQESAAYCRGCAVNSVEGAAAGAVIGNAIANAAQNPQIFAPPPPPPGIVPADLPNEAMGSATCHVQKQQSGTGRSWNTAEVCE